MKLEQLLKGVSVKKIIGNGEIEITDVKENSNCIGKGSLFVAHKGKENDGKNYVKQVEMYGGVAILSESEVETHLTQVIVEDTRKAIGQLCANFYLNVHKKMRFVGAIGTNGKTTTTHMIYNVLKDVGKKCGLIGTLGCYYGDKFTKASLTTPDPIQLYKTFYDMYVDGVEIVVMEVSAHAIYWQKVFGIDFEVALFTNLSQDHLDFFKDMEEYKKTKISFFKSNKCKYVVTNSDDKVGFEISGLIDNSITYGIENPADVFAIDLVESDSGVNFVINLFDCIHKVNLNYIGKFNAYNAMGALTALSLLGINPEVAVNSLQKQRGVEGRLECVHRGEYAVYVDYAHTPDGLSKVLSTLKATCKNKLLCVFGCGGNRDNSKRKIMGKISGEIADFTIITSDNPRYEEPMEIIKQIEEGILSVSKKYVLIENRRQGIEYALSIATKGDVVLIAGKGGENYQEILGIKHVYNDKDTIKEIIRGNEQ
ncbi:MAG: UDP-N-acetylmuramoyl-L-alanyl-D-glutamate--2,6-diaminopimelate ligase [Clostridia bacterium]|nr:UDP-N-acetylmuramoyl-L-alanyl-D-glutamate--2,6-diaminopimelate ligase [Clostridia bacterium]